VAPHRERIHAEDHRRAPRSRWTGSCRARRTHRGSDQRLYVRWLGDALFRSGVRRGIERLFSEKFDLLLGRKTDETFAAYWPYYDPHDPHGDIAKLFNDIKKYVVWRSGDVDTSWQGSVLLRDIADVRRLKQEDGPSLVTQGSRELVHALLANDLVDALGIFTVPIVLGRGKKLFADGSKPHAFNLTRSRVSPKGLIVGHYERSGAITIGGAELDSPSERESARQARMKRQGC